MDIVERLRERARPKSFRQDQDDLLIEAADEIERLRKALRIISLLPCEWVVHEIAVAALKGDE